MKIHFDISHVAHLNFFSNAIKQLNAGGHRVFLTVLDRGSLIAIARREFAEYEIFKSGRHRGGVWSIIVEANVIKFFRLLAFYMRSKPDVTLSCGGFVAGAVMMIAGRKNYQFDDDPEWRNNVRLERFTSTLLYFPRVVEQQGNIRLYNGVKEWAYLSPRSFTPDEAALSEYNLLPGSYFFVREVSRKTLNYMNQEKDPVIEAIIGATKGTPVLFSLEVKTDRNLYPDDWVMLKEPVSDIHSLIYYSRALISSGDSMAREACVLGVPAYYCGGRRMAVNDFLSSTGLFHDVELRELAGSIGTGDYDETERKLYRHGLMAEWDDITGLIVSLATAQNTRKS